MDHHQTIEATQTKIKYRFYLLKRVGDRLFITGGIPKRISASAYQHVRLYGGKLSVCRNGSGMVAELIEARVRPASAKVRPFYAHQLEAMEPGTTKVFEWHEAKGKATHPVIYALSKLNKQSKGGVRYTQQCDSSGVRVYRWKNEIA